MARLLSELRRLYFPHSSDPIDTPAPEGTDATHGRIADLVDAEGRVRALILEIDSPADWERTSAVWRGVQRDLELPAPAIAVSGLNGFQLWFSLAEAVPAAQAQAFLDAVRSRFLADVAARRIRQMPAADQPARQSLADEAIVPARQQSGNWSAFVASDLAPIFVETPWLDIAPGEDGQADLLRGIRSIKQPEWEAALAQLGLLPPASTTAVERPAPSNAGPGLKDTNAQASTACQDASQFLLRVMNDDTVALALRIEAAKALLQHGDGRDASLRS